MNLSPLFRQRFFDDNGVMLSGGQLYTYAAGTTTPQATYSNSTGTANTNPVVLDSYGYADVWLDPTLAYKIVLEDVNGNVLWTVDNVTFPVGVSQWNSNAIYSEGNIVADSSGYGLFYVSLVNSNQGNALTDVSAWRALDGNVRTVSANTNIAVTDNLIRSNSTSGSLTHTLPSCSTTPVGKVFMIKDVGTGGNTTSVSCVQDIDGATTYVTALNQNNTLRVMNNGTTYDVI